MGGVASERAARDEQPTCVPLHPYLHQETTGVHMVNKYHIFQCNSQISDSYSNHIE